MSGGQKRPPVGSCGYFEGNETENRRETHPNHPLIRLDWKCDRIHNRQKKGIISKMHRKTMQVIHFQTSAKILKILFFKEKQHIHSCL